MLFLVPFPPFFFRSPFKPSYGRDVLPEPDFDEPLSFSRAPSNSFFLACRLRRVGIGERIFCHSFFRGVNVLLFFAFPASSVRRSRVEVERFRLLSHVSFLPKRWHLPAPFMMQSLSFSPPNWTLFFFFLGQALFLGGRPVGLERAFLNPASPFQTRTVFPFRWALSDATLAQPSPLLSPSPLSSLTFPFLLRKTPVFFFLLSSLLPATV